jgi:uncharacterized protein YjbJ (UPF0337 family)
MSINKDQVRGRVNQAEGKIKQVVGKIVGDRKLEAKGKVQGVFGKAQTKFGNARQTMKDSSKKGT